MTGTQLIQASMKRSIDGQKGWINEQYRYRVVVVDLTLSKSRNMASQRQQPMMKVNSLNFYFSIKRSPPCSCQLTNKDYLLVRSRGELTEAGLWSLDADPPHELIPTIFDRQFLIGGEGSRLAIRAPGKVAEHFGNGEPSPPGGNSGP